MRWRRRLVSGGAEGVEAAWGPDELGDGGAVGELDLGVEVDEGALYNM